VKRANVIMPMVLVLVLAVAIATTGPLLVERIAYAAARGVNTADREELVKLSQREQLSRLFRLVAKTIKPAVVEVWSKTKVRVRMPQMDPYEFLRPFRGEEPFPGWRMPAPRRLPEPRPQPRSFWRQGLGSGVIVDAEKGYILTNNHVVADPDKLKVLTHDRREFEVEWVRRDPDSDLAVVKVKNPKGLIAAPLGDSDAAEVGDWVLAVGAPERLPQTVTAGIISAKDRASHQRTYGAMIQTDAAINRGNSGGPLVNMRGEVIGINTYIVSRIGQNEGIGMAIPSNLAKNVMQQLIDKGEVVRGWLGVSIKDVDEDLVEHFKLPNAGGALVMRVLEGTPAAKAGIKEEDFIVAVDNEPIKSATELRERVAKFRPDQEVKVTVYRAGEKKTVTVKLGTRPADVGERPEREEGRSRPQRYGLEVQTLTKELAERYGYDEKTKGVVITEVEGDSNAAENGLRAGMVIDKAAPKGSDLKPVATAEEFASAVAAAAGKKIVVRVVLPNDTRNYVTISPK